MTTIQISRLLVLCIIHYHVVLFYFFIFAFYFFGAGVATGPIYGVFIRHCLFLRVEVGDSFSFLAFLK